MSTTADGAARSILTRLDDVITEKEPSSRLDLRRARERAAAASSGAAAAAAAWLRRGWPAGQLYAFAVEAAEMAEKLVTYVIGRTWSDAVLALGRPERMPRPPP